jgi:hypothetical protein
MPTRNERLRARFDLQEIIEDYRNGTESASESQANARLILDQFTRVRSVAPQDDPQALREQLLGELAPNERETLLAWLEPTAVPAPRASRAASPTPPALPPDLVPAVEALRVDPPSPPARVRAAEAPTLPSPPPPERVPAPEPPMVALSPPPGRVPALGASTLVPPPPPSARVRAPEAPTLAPLVPPDRQRSRAPAPQTELAPAPACAAAEQLVGPQATASLRAEAIALCCSVREEELPDFLERAAPFVGNFSSLASRLASVSGLLPWLTDSMRHPDHTPAYYAQLLNLGRSLPEPARFRLFSMGLRCAHPDLLLEISATLRYTKPAPLQQLAKLFYLSENPLPGTSLLRELFDSTPDGADAFSVGLSWVHPHPGDPRQPSTFQTLAHKLAKKCTVSTNATAYAACFNAICWGLGHLSTEEAPQMFADLDAHLPYLMSLTPAVRNQVFERIDQLDRCVAWLQNPFVEHYRVPDEEVHQVEHGESVMNGVRIQHAKATLRRLFDLYPDVDTGYYLNQAVRAVEFRQNDPSTHGTRLNDDILTKARAMLSHSHVVGTNSTYDLSADPRREVKVQQIVGLLWYVSRFKIADEHRKSAEDDFICCLANDIKGRFTERDPSGDLWEAYCQEGKAQKWLTPFLGLHPTIKECAYVPPAALTQELTQTYHEKGTGDPKLNGLLFLRLRTLQSAETHFDPDMRERPTGRNDFEQLIDSVESFIAMTYDA